MDGFGCSAAIAAIHIRLVQANCCHLRIVGGFGRGAAISRVVHVCQSPDGKASSCSESVNQLLRIFAEIPLNVRIHKNILQNDLP